jgi:hypothetical protein
MHRFSFNLLPEKPKEEIEKEEGRENTSLTLAFLPFFAVLISIVLIILNNIVFQAQINSWNAAITNRKNEISSYQDIIKLNIEFSQKTVLLEEPVAQDIEPEQFFSLADEIVNNLPFSADISKYGRNPDGSFDITLTTIELDSSADIIRAFELNGRVDTPNLKSINVDSEFNEVQTTVNFFLVNTDIAQNG